MFSVRFPVGIANASSKSILWKGPAVLALGMVLTTGPIESASAFMGPNASIAPVGNGGATLTDVRFRGRGGGFGGRRFGHRGFGGRGYGYGGGYGYGVGAGLAGLAAGAVIGGAIAASQAAPAGDPVAYCQSRFRSYNPSTGTYTGYDGQAHPCP